jgi:hypothetical protein
MICINEKEYDRLVRTAAKAIERKKALRSLQRAHDMKLRMIEWQSARYQQLRDVAFAGFVGVLPKKRRWWEFWR